MTCRLNVLYKCVKFLLNISDGYQDIERTGNSIATDQRKITKNIKSRVMVIAHDTLSNCGLEVYEVSTK